MTREALNIAERTDTMALMDTGSDHLDSGWFCHRDRIAITEENDPTERRKHPASAQKPGDGEFDDELCCSDASFGSAWDSGLENP